MANYLTIQPEHTHADGMKLCGDAAQKMGFFGATPIVQPADAAQAAVASSAIADAAGSAPTAAEFNAAVARINALTALVNALQDALKDLGLIKGGAAQ